jgi:hypothetical protein
MRPTPSRGYHDDPGICFDRAKARSRHFGASRQHIWHRVVSLCIHPCGGVG